MAFYVTNTVRLNLTGSDEDDTFDTLIGLKGTEADNWVKGELYKIYERSGRLQEFPIFDISNGNINGSTADQQIKDLSTNRTTYLCLLGIRQFEAAKEYKETVKGQLETVEAHLHVTEETSFPAAII